MLMIFLFGISPPFMVWFRILVSQTVFWIIDYIMLIFTQLDFWSDVASVCSLLLKAPCKFFASSLLVLAVLWSFLFCRNVASHIILNSSSGSWCVVLQTSGQMLLECALLCVATLCSVKLQIFLTSRWQCSRCEINFVAATCAWFLIWPGFNCAGWLVTCDLVLVMQFGF